MAADTRLSAAQIETAAALAGTPLYAYSAPALRARAQALRGAIPEAEFVFSLKSNPNPSIVRCLAEQGIGAEVCSLFELETSLAAGVAADRTILVGPAKSPQELRRAIAAGVKAIIAESLEELAMIDTLAAELGRVQSVALRINPAFHTRGAKLSMSGKPTQFGIDAEDLDASLAVCAAARAIRLAGLHVYMGTRILDHAVVVENTRNVLALADEIIARAGHPLEFVDIGGGWGVPYSADETALDFEALATQVNALAAAWKARNPGAHVIIELGRYMVAEAGVFVTAVRYVKTSKGTRFAVCDGGANVHGAAGTAAGFRRNFPIGAVRPRAGETGRWSVSGPLCTPTDVIGQKVDLPPLQPGDLLRIERSGAYGFSASPVHFLSFATPAEVLVDGDRFTRIRAPGSLQAHLAQFAPEALLPQTDAARLPEPQPAEV